MREAKSIRQNQDRTRTDRRREIQNNLLCYHASIPDS